MTNLKIFFDLFSFNFSFFPYAEFVRLRHILKWLMIMKRITIPYSPFLRSSAKAIVSKENLTLNLLAVPLGIFCGYVAMWFRMLIMFFQNIFFYQNISVENTLIINNTLGWKLIFIPAIGGIIVGLIVYFVAREAKGHGVPEVMEAVVLKEGKIRLRVVLAKAFASGICIASGGASGREGPIVQIGSALGSSLGQWLKLRPSMIRVLVGCGAAGSIAATFNTPIAGVIFAFEVILFEFKTRSFVPLVVSTVFATIVSRHYLGDQPAFLIPEYSFNHPAELGFYLILGILSGLLAVVVVKSLYGMEGWFDRLPFPEYLKPALGGLGVGAIGYFCFPHAMGLGYETIEGALHGHLGIVFLLIMILLKIVSLSLTLGSGGSGGIFAPNLFIGAMLGGAFGLTVNYLFPDIAINPGAYALVGMAALFSGVSRATLTSMIILFEMTRDYHIILPLMFACVVADGITRALMKETIYTKKLANRGVYIDTDMEVNPLEIKLVRDYMTKDIQFVYGNDIIRTVWDLVLTTDHHGFPVLNRKDRLIGIITEGEIRKALRESRENQLIKDVMASELIVTYLDENLNRALTKMMFHDICHLPVVHRDDSKKIIGFLTRTDIMTALSDKK